MERNAEILMQILRDREYTAAYESGKRLYYFDDADWAASQKEGPVFEVRLTYSGGREADGSPRQPLRFAFNVDLERQTVEPGGSSISKPTPCTPSSMNRGFRRKNAAAWRKIPKSW